MLQKESAMNCTVFPFWFWQWSLFRFSCFVFAFKPIHFSLKNIPLKFSSLVPHRQAKPRSAQHRGVHINRAQKTLMNWWINYLISSLKSWQVLIQGRLEFNLRARRNLEDRSPVQFSHFKYEALKLKRRGRESPNSQFSALLSTQTGLSRGHFRYKKEHQKGRETRKNTITMTTTTWQDWQWLTNNFILPDTHSPN